MTEVLSLSMRPKRFSEMVGQEKLLRKIRGHFASGRIPKAWMFVGEKGCGKTTIARILSVSVQCRHGEPGEPCVACWKKRRDFNITQIPAAKFNKKEELESMLESSGYVPGLGSRKRVFILDELQAASYAAKELLLEYFEDAPATTMWIANTTRPETIPATLQSRCIKYTVAGLDESSVRVLVKKALSLVRSKLASQSLVDALVEAGVTSPRLILMAVEKYVAGSSPEEAALVEVSTEFDVNAVWQCLRQGDWEKVARHIREAKPEDVRGIRNYLAKVLSNLLLDESDFSKRTQIIASGIRALATNYGDDMMALSSLSAILYDLARQFREYKR